MSRRGAIVETRDGVDVRGYDLLEGDRDLDRRVLSSRIVRRRKQGACFICAGCIKAGQLAWVRAEVVDGDLWTATVCVACCELITADDQDGIESRYAIGWDARARSVEHGNGDD